MPPPPPTILAHSPAPLTLGTGPVVTPLAGTGPGLAARLDALPPGHSLYLLVRGLTAHQPPGVIYTAYLDLPAGANPTEKDPHLLGYINFYGARPPGAATTPPSILAAAFHCPSRTARTAATPAPG